MRYRAIPSPDRRFGRVVRAVAAVDITVAMLLAVPFTSVRVIEFLFRLDRMLGLDTPPVALVPSFVLPVNAAGLLAVASAVGRLSTQTVSAARIDAWRRLLSAGLLLYYVLRRGQTPTLLVFVVTELAAATIQGLAARRFSRTTGG